jgi:hypothetical protein
MKKTCIMTAVLMLAFVSLAFSAEDVSPDETSGASFEQKKADKIRKLDKQIIQLQKGKACVQAATDHKTLKACRKKIKEERVSNRPPKKK